MVKELPQAEGVGLFCVVLERKKQKYGCFWYAELNLKLSTRDNERLQVPSKKMGCA
jgi:hypothetical protein